MTENKTLLWVAIGGVAALVAYRAMQGTALVVSHSIVSGDNGGGNPDDEMTNHILVPSFRRMPMDPAARIAQQVIGGAPSAPGGGATGFAPSIGLGGGGAAPAVVTSPNASSPASSPSAFNPNVAGPIVAPSDYAPIPSYSDPIIMQPLPPADPGVFTPPIDFPIQITDPPFPSPVIIYDPPSAPDPAPDPAPVYEPAPSNDTQYI